MGTIRAQIIFEEIKAKYFQKLREDTDKSDHSKQTNTKRIKRHKETNHRKANGKVKILKAPTEKTHLLKKQQ